ncbi:hypothetical protein [Amycolatopsis sp. NPDC059021]|uniref:hypothetical protein n=1 Tax=Amycolatopsis sp. NPDC059021 TaxID=3346704 RepID=UPI00366DDD34
MTEPKDPERLLADALRAQAVFAPQVDHTPVAEQSTEQSAVTGSAAFVAPSSTEGELPPRYGLLSGAGADSLERAALELGDPPQPTPPPPASTTQSGPTQPVLAQPIPAPVPEAETVRAPQATTGAPLPVHWILLLALLLGLAAGSVIGLLTLV